MLYSLLVAAALCGVTETHTVVMSENETTRVYVPAVLPDGSETELPIINGYVPSIIVKTTDEDVAITLDYRNCTKYNAEIHGKFLDYRKQPPKKQPKLPELRSRVVPVLPPPPILLKEVVPVEKPASFLRKPSEVRD